MNDGSISQFDSGTFNIIHQRNNFAQVIKHIPQEQQIQEMHVKQLLEQQQHNSTPKFSNIHQQLLHLIG